MSLRAQALRANIADPRGRPALLLGALALGLAAFCVAYTNWSMVVENGGPSIEGFDDTGYYIWARSMVIDGDLDFENDVASAPTIPEDARALWLEELPRSPTGRVTNKYPPGWALASLPAFLAGHAWALVSEAPEDGWSRPYFVAVWIWQLALGGLGLWWAWKVTARFAPPPIAATAVLAMWIASPMIYYHTARIGMAHGLLFTLLAGVHHHTFALREGRNEIWRWATLGGLSALAALTRSTAVLFLLFPALVVFSRLRAQNGSQRGRPLAALLAPWAAAGVSRC